MQGKEKTGPLSPVSHKGGNRADCPRLKGLDGLDDHAFRQAEFANHASSALRRLKDVALRHRSRSAVEQRIKQPDLGALKGDAAARHAASEGYSKSTTGMPVTSLIRFARSGLGRRSPRRILVMVDGSTSSSFASWAGFLPVSER